MNGVELAKATAQYDGQMVIDKFSRPSRDARARWTSARRKR
jgi:hypothetical protein